jgi:hypothetical protein
MTKLLKITFHNPNGTSEAAQKAAWERAEQIAVWPGLIWKIWIADPELALYGGIYLFRDEASASAYLDGPVVASIRTIPGVSQFETQLFDVANDLSVLTHGPI